MATLKEQGVTIEKLLEQIPEPLQGVVTTYGPSLLAMTYDELWQWLELITQGNTELAYKTIVNRLTNSEFATEWETNLAKWKKLNAENVEFLKVVNAAQSAVLRALIQVVLILIGI